MIAQLAAEYEALRLRVSLLGDRVELLENAVPPTIEQLTTDYGALTWRVNLLKARVAALESATPSTSVHLLFSDLLAGPKTGWSLQQPNRGAAVSIWAPSFGGPHGANYVTVNGCRLLLDSDYAEWNADSFDVKFLKRTTFWLNSACADGPGEITVTINGVKSNALPFTVIAGQIWFAKKDAPAGGDGSHDKPWHHLNINSMNGVQRLRPGDVLYIRESPTPWNERYAGGHQNLYMIGFGQHGREDAPIAMAAYPGEKPEFDSLVAYQHGVVDGNISIDREWWTLSKLSLRSALAGTLLFSRFGARMVGCDCIACQSPTAAAPICTFGSRANVLGNSCHHGASGSKLDHSIYISGNPSEVKGVRLAYNYCYANDYGAGPQLVINHQQNRIPAGSQCKQHEIDHNLVDCSQFPSRAIGVYSQSYEPANPNEPIPQPALIHHNLVIGGSGSACYMNEGQVEWFDNVLINCFDVGFSVGANSVYSYDIENNVVHMLNGKYIALLVQPQAQSLVAGNTWLGVGNAPAIDESPKTRDVAELLANYYSEWVGKL